MHKHDGTCVPLLVLYLGGEMTTLRSSQTTFIAEACSAIALIYISIFPTSRTRSVDFPDPIRRPSQPSPAKWSLFL